MTKIIKVSTGLTGLPVCSNPNHILNAVYGKILRAISKMPEDAAYRKYTEKIIIQRKQLIANKHDVRTLEETICAGQAEELIVQAENELALARKMLGWKPWELLTQDPPEKQWDWPPSKVYELKS